jgi:hypothetical protein
MRFTGSSRASLRPLHSGSCPSSRLKPFFNGPKKSPAIAGLFRFRVGGSSGYLVASAKSRNVAVALKSFSFPPNEFGCVLPTLNFLSSPLAVPSPLLCLGPRRLALHESGYNLHVVCHASKCASAFRYLASVVAQKPRPTICICKLSRH